MSSYVTFFSQNFLRNPVRATLSSFAKVTKILGDNLLTEEPRPALERQISEQIMSIELPSSEVEAPTEYTLVELEWTLPEPQSAPRGPPLTRKDWKRFIDAEGRISDPQEVKQIIYRGVSQTRRYSLSASSVLVFHARQAVSPWFRV